MNWNDFDAALFDLDGVLTPTAEVHQRAWQDMFDEFLASRPSIEAYGPDDYFTYVDGRPRYDGVAAFLASRSIELPHGDPSDAPAAVTVCGLGNRKNALFDRLLGEQGIEPYPGSVRLIHHLIERGTDMAVVSSSRNAREVLTTAGLIQYFEIIVDGMVAEAEGLAGKPSPATYLDAATKLGAEVTRTVVFEDAVSGVQSGRAGHFGRVIGVDRGAGRAILLENGADQVVEDLGELT